MEKQDFLTKNQDLLSDLQESETIKESSKKTYLNTYYKIAKLLNIFDLREILYDPETYAEELKEHQEGETYKHSIKSLLSLMNHSGIKSENKDLYNYWYGFFAEEKEKLETRRLNQEPTERQKKAYVQWEDIIIRRDKIEDKLSQEYILMCLITMIPPRRQEDWRDVTVYNNPNPHWMPTSPEANHINIGYHTPYILLSKYKTANKYGKWYKKIPTLLLKIMKSRYTSESQKLFTTTENKTYNSVKHFAMWSNKTIKAILDNSHSSMNTLRHSYASYMMRTNPNMSLLMRKTLARDMGHSIEETMAYDNNRDS